MTKKTAKTRRLRVLEIVYCCLILCSACTSHASNQFECTKHPTELQERPFSALFSSQVSSFFVFHKRLESEKPETPLLAISLTNIGRLYHSQQHYTLASRCYERALALDSRFDTLYLLADSYRQQQRTSGLDALYEMLLNKDSAYTPAWLARFELALLANDDPHAEEMLAMAELVSDHSPQSMLARAKYQLIKQDYKAALLTYQKIIKLSPSSNALYQDMASIAKKLEQHDQANSFTSQIGDTMLPIKDSLVSSVLRLRRPDQIYRFRGLMSTRINDHQEAITYYKLALKINPTDIETMLDMASSYAQLKAHESAIQTLNEAYRIQPDNTLVNVKLGRLLMQRRPEIALSYLLKALTQRKRDVSLIKDIAQSYEQLGQRDDALKYYTMFIDSEPFVEDILIKRVQLLVSLQRYDDAMTKIAADWENNASLGRLTHLYARLLASVPDKSLRNGDKAIELARTVVDAQSNTQRLETLAMAYAENGDCKESAYWQQKAINFAKQLGELTRKQHDQLRIYQNGAPCAL